MDTLRRARLIGGYHAYRAAGMDGYFQRWIQDLSESDQQFVMRYMVAERGALMHARREAVQRDRVTNHRLLRGEAREFINP